MASSIVFTLSGDDRVGLVEDVTRILLQMGGNVGASRMARLGGEFAILMMVTLPSGADASTVEQAFAEMTAAGYSVTVTPARQDTTAEHAGWLAYTVDVEGADHEGIVHGIAAFLSRAGINIESMETGAIAAPISGTPLFTMHAQVLVPPGVPESEWTAQLDDAARDAGVDIRVAAEA